MRRWLLISASFFVLPFLAAAQAAHSHAMSSTPAHTLAHTSFQVQLAASAPKPLSGRLLLFLKQGKGDKSVDSQEFKPEDAYVASMDVHDLAPGSTVQIDADQVVFPRPMSSLPVGDYEAQAVLDPDLSYNYGGRTSADWISSVIELPHFKPGTSAMPAALVIDRHAEEDENRTARMQKMMASVKPGEFEKVEFESPLLTSFWGRPTMVRAWVVLPPGYAEHASEHYPTAYWAAGFGGVLDSGLGAGMRLRERMDAGKMPPMIWVMLDESCAHGTHEFADSVNNGPWGAALTTEYIPMLERRYRMDAKPAGRFLNGHSSGGWATLQLQVNYPQIFGGTWSTSPDPSDFHDFTGPDLYATNANVYRKPDGSANPIMRMDGKVIATLQQFAQLEQVLGPYGGQMSSFEWVFSPRGEDGAPMPMFDRTTGTVDPKVAAYWADHYDLANLTERTWAQRGPMLKGRIHLYVGTADTFYLDGAAHRFEARLQALGAEPHFTYLPGRSHFDMYVVDKDAGGLFDEIAKQMYAVARPSK